MPTLYLMPAWCPFLQAKQANRAYHPPKAGGKGQKQGEGGGHHHSHSDKQVLMGKRAAFLLQSA